MTNSFRQLALRVRALFSNTFKRKHLLVRIGEKVRLRAGVKISFHNNSHLVIGERSKIKEYAVLECYGTILIGKDSVIGAHNWLQGSGHIDIGDSVMMGPHCSIVASEHSHSEATRPFAEQPFISGRVTIGNNVWIGSHVTILNNVKIGDNVVIGAHSLVNKDVADNCVVVGAPVRVLRKL